MNETLMCSMTARQAVRSPHERSVRRGLINYSQNCRHHGIVPSYTVPAGTPHLPAFTSSTPGTCSLHYVPPVLIFSPYLTVFVRVYQSFYRAMLRISADYAVVRCLSVRLVSVTFVYCTKTSKHIINLLSSSAVTPF